jgi:hypothetical protein
VTKINFEMAKTGFTCDGRRTADSGLANVSTGRRQPFGNGPAND